MPRLTLRVESPDETKEIVLDRDEISFGRSDISDVVLGDSGLSRKNTTFFRDGEDFLVVDENSTNGTFLNGRQLTGGPERLRNGDRVKMGNGTGITVLIGDVQQKEAPLKIQQPVAVAAPKLTVQPFTNKRKLPFPILIGGASVIVIILFSLLGILAVNLFDDTAPQTKPTTTTIVTSALVPVRVVDPLGGEDPDDLDDLIASWETSEQELNVDTVRDVSGTSDAELNVTAAFLAQQKSKAMAARTKETGIRPAGLDVPKELFGDGVIKQKVKLSQMKTAGYQQPMDFAELAQKRLNGELIEMPMATDSFYLDVGGSAQDTPFSAFNFQNGVTPIDSGTPKWDILSKLASNFAGQLYNLGESNDRKQMRMRLLRMFNPRAKPILKELADAYSKQFNRPLRVTSLTRSMDYQILLNQTNANSFKVRGEGSLPPHTSGCAFDLARKHMDVDEQNFLMQKLASMEREGKLDALIEYGVNACFHIFIYFDGKTPAM